MKSKKKKKKLSNKPFEMDDVLVSKIGRTIYFYDDVDNDSVCKTIRFLDELELASSKKEITIKICSNGGYLYSGLSLYDRIRQSSCQINTVASGIVASMATIIYLAGDYRYIEENATLMNHQVFDEIEGRTDDLKISVKELDRIQQKIVGIVAQHTRLTEFQVVKDVQRGDDYIAPEQAIEDGFAHELLKNDRVIKRRKKKDKKEVEKRKMPTKKKGGK
jgi:ATP-dependent Clp endopeptidase proteolytic subunit ClpP